MMLNVTQISLTPLLTHLLSEARTSVWWAWRKDSTKISLTRRATTKITGTSACRRAFTGCCCVTSQRQSIQDRPKKPYFRLRHYLCALYCPNNLVPSMFCIYAILFSFFLYYAVVPDEINPLYFEFISGIIKMGYVEVKHLEVIEQSCWENWNHQINISKKHLFGSLPQNKKKIFVNQCSQSTSL